MGENQMYRIIFTLWVCTRHLACWASNQIPVMVNLNPWAKHHYWGIPWLLLPKLPGLIINPCFFGTRAKQALTKGFVRSAVCILLPPSFIYSGINYGNSLNVSSNFCALRSMQGNSLSRVRWVNNILFWPYFKVGWIVTIKSRDCAALLEK